MNPVHNHGQARRFDRNVRLAGSYVPQRRRCTANLHKSEWTHGCFDDGGCEHLPFTFFIEKVHHDGN
jgi:hypothetical protein